MSSPMSEFQHLKIPLESIRNATNNFAEANSIGKGGFGEVFRGKFTKSKLPIVAAVKRLTPSDNQEGDADFWREIMLLSNYKHENIIVLLGFCHQIPERILVYEYAPNNSLEIHLRDPKISWVQRLKICLGVARGLEYLHNPRGSQKRVLHRDIKSANILLDENWNAKIADFGFSKYGPANQKHTMLITEPKGTLGYCDPVFIETACYKKESDVYSFGVVLFEVLCSRLCVDSGFNDIRRCLTVYVKKYSKEKIRDTIIDSNLLQQMEQKSFDTFVTLAYQCLEIDWEQRPAMDLIVKMIETALDYQEGRNALPSNKNLASSSTAKAGKKKLDLNAQKHGPMIQVAFGSRFTTAQKEQAGRNIVNHRLAEDYAIKRWSTGNRENLPALLSTLQDILGPESGWEPVSLREMREAWVVRDTYRKAVSENQYHKLKERRANTREKYIVGKVLEILRGTLIKFEADETEKKHKTRETFDRWEEPNRLNLAALLSTLEDILGPESGWEPVSVTDNTEECVREAYEKSGLLTHPDQVKKRGLLELEALLYSFVHDSLETAWNHLVQDDSDDRDGSETDADDSVD